MRKFGPRKFAHLQDIVEKFDEFNKLTIDFDRYLPTVLSSLVAKFRANANVFFTASYGVSLAKWRILSFLAEHGPASGADEEHVDRAQG